MDFIYIVLWVFLGFFLHVVISYSKEKGKNLATKEDIGEITAKVEAVRLENAQKLESLKSSLTHRINLNSFRYEQEFTILQELTEKLVAVRDTARSLRPVMDSYDPKESEEERKTRRLNIYSESARDLYKVAEIRQPFYPEEIYKLIKELEKVSWSEAIRYRHHDPDDPKRFDTYWKEAEENSEKIAGLSQGTIDAIRRRVVSWEDP